MRRAGFATLVVLLVACGDARPPTEPADPPPPSANRGGPSSERVPDALVRQCLEEGRCEPLVNLLRAALDATEDRCSRTSDLAAKQDLAKEILDWWVLVLQLGLEDSFDFDAEQVCSGLFDESATFIEVEPDETTLLLGETLALTATIRCGDRTCTGKVIWGSSDERIASVDENGEVRARGPGTATIAIESVDIAQVNGFAVVHVRRPVVTFALSPDGQPGYVGIPSQDPLFPRAGVLACPWAISAAVDTGSVRLLGFEFVSTEASDGTVYLWFDQNVDATLEAPQTDLSTESRAQPFFDFPARRQRFPTHVTTSITADLDYGDGNVVREEVGSAECAVPGGQGMDASLSLIGWSADTRQEGPVEVTEEGIPLFLWTHECRANWQVSVTGGSGFVAQDLATSWAEEILDASTGAFISAFIHAPFTTFLASIGSRPTIAGDVFPLIADFDAGAPVNRVFSHSYVAAQRQLDGISGRLILRMYTSDGSQFVLTASAPCAPQF